MDLLTVLLRTFLSYFIVLLVFRLLGKKEVGELSLLDLIVFLMIAEVAAMSIEDVNMPFIHVPIAAFSLLIIQKILSYLSLKNNVIRSALDGKPSIIIYQGKINFDEMKKQNYSFDDLVLQVREEGLRSISEVEYAILENTGDLSIFKKDKVNIIPLPVIVSGSIVKENVQFLNKTEQSIKNELNMRNVKISDVYYAIYEYDVLFLITKDNFL